jgi:ADP-ribose pyrophosphatase YjhB (NUDIX family)
MGKGIEVIARAVIVENDHVFLCQKVDKAISYLPGGHVERDESARASLLREFEEEFWGKGKIGAFLGVVEHAYTKQNGKSYHEINLIFAARLLNLSYPQTPQVRESDLSFHWRPLATLPEAALEPAPMREIVAAYGENGRFWGSTIET